MKKFVITYNGHNDRYRVDDIFANDKDEAISKARIDKKKIVSIVEIEPPIPSETTKSKCQICHKPFKVGESVYDYNELEKCNITYIISKDIVKLDLGRDENTKYIIHENDMDKKILEEYRNGRRLWEKGVNICGDIKEKIFKEVYK